MPASRRLGARAVDAALALCGGAGGQKWIQAGNERGPAAHGAVVAAQAHAAGVVDVKVGGHLHALQAAAQQRGHFKNAAQYLYTASAHGADGGLDVAHANTPFVISASMNCESSLSTW